MNILYHLEFRQFSNASSAIKLIKGNRPSTMLFSKSYMLLHAGDEIYFGPKANPHFLSYTGSTIVTKNTEMFDLSLILLQHVHPNRIRRVLII